VAPKGSHGQNGVSIRKNCPIEGFSWTKKEVNQEKLSNRMVLMDKMEAQSGKTVQ